MTRKCMVSELVRASDHSRSGVWILEESYEATFHQFGTGYEELETGVGSYSTALVEKENGTIASVPAEHIRFLPEVREGCRMAGDVLTVKYPSTPEDPNFDGWPPPPSAGDVRLRGLRELCGYVENGSDTVVKIFQDDATKDWLIKAGSGANEHRWIASSFNGVIDAMMADFPKGD